MKASIAASRARGPAVMALLLLALSLAAVSGFGAEQAVGEIVPEAGLAWIGNFGDTGRPSAFVGLFGVAIPFRLGWLPAPMFLGVAVDLFGIHYEYTDGRAVPTEAVTASGFFTLAALLSPRLGARWQLGPAIEAGGLVGLDVLLRFPLDPFYRYQPSVDGRLPALIYFFEGRFFYPETGLFLRWRAADSWSFETTLRALWPVFHLWDGESLPFFDQAIVAATLGICVKLGGKKVEEDRAETAAEASP